MSSRQLNLPPKKIVIVGGGIIGCTTAYYLSHHPSFRSDIDEITILEASTIGVAQGASGKAGGLVAKWAYPRELVDVSFPEHVRLAELHNGAQRWGWRYLNCGDWEGQGEESPASVEPGSNVGDGGVETNLEKTAGLEDSDPERRKGRALPDDLRWVNAPLTNSYTPIAGDGDTTQVHPYLFTTSMLELAQSKGVKLIAGSIAFDMEKVTGVFYQSLSAPMQFAPATHAILCAGPWTPTILPCIPVKATRVHSIVIRPPPDVQITPYALFTKIDLPGAINGKTATPEIYARPNNEVYSCGPEDKSPLPQVVDHVKVDEAACDTIFQHVASISPQLRAGTVVKKQACFLPTVKKGKLGGPIVGPAPRVAKGYYIATGHTCWGICNAPGTAKVLTELVYEGKITSANLANLAPSKYAPTL